MKKVLVVLVALLCLVGMTNAQSKMGVSVQGAVTLPMGDFGDACKTGFGGVGTFMYFVNPNLAITGTAGYLMHDFKNMSDATFNIIPILGGVRYVFGKDKFLPYVAGQVGIYSYKTKVTVFGFSVETSESKFGFAGGGGFLYKLGDKLNLDINATFNSISTEGNATNFLTVGAGIMFAF